MANCVMAIFFDSDSSEEVHSLQGSASDLLPKPGNLKSPRVDVD